MQELTPFDEESIIMIESLIGHNTETYQFDRCFAILADYDQHRDPDYINALINAVRGRFGERFISVEDFPENTMLKFKVAYSTENLPFVFGILHEFLPVWQMGDEYFRWSANPDGSPKKEYARALQVRRNGDTRLINFCGNGELYVERQPGVNAWFTFLNNGTYVDVPEYDWIVRRDNSNAFEIYKNKDFQHLWRKEEHR